MYTLFLSDDNESKSLFKMFKNSNLKFNVNSSIEEAFYEAESAGNIEKMPFIKLPNGSYVTENFNSILN